MDDNKIERIERRAFMNLNELEHLSLRGNKLNNLAEESFQVSWLKKKEKNTDKFYWKPTTNSFVKWARIIFGV